MELDDLAPRSAGALDRVEQAEVKGLPPGSRNKDTISYTAPIAYNGSFTSPQNPTDPNLLQSSNPKEVINHILTNKYCLVLPLLFSYFRAIQQQWRNERKKKRNSVRRLDYFLARHNTSYTLSKVQGVITYLHSIYSIFLKYLLCRRCKGEAIMHLHSIYSIYPRCSSFVIGATVK